MDDDFDEFLFEGDWPGSPVSSARYDYISANDFPAGKKKNINQSVGNKRNSDLFAYMDGELPTQPAKINQHSSAALDQPQGQEASKFELRTKKILSILAAQTDTVAVARADSPLHVDHDGANATINDYSQSGSEQNVASIDSIGVLSNPSLETSELNIGFQRIDELAYQPLPPVSYFIPSCPPVVCPPPLSLSSPFYPLTQPLPKDMMDSAPSRHNPSSAAQMTSSASAVGSKRMMSSSLFVQCGMIVAYCSGSSTMHWKQSKLAPPADGAVESSGLMLLSTAAVAPTVAPFTLKGASETLSIPYRRITDIAAVLEELGMIRRETLRPERRKLPIVETSSTKHCQFWWSASFDRTMMFLGELQRRDLMRERREAGDDSGPKLLGFAVLCFLQLFLLGHDHVSMLDAIRLIKEKEGTEESAGINSSRECKESTHTKRFYDAANILSSLGFLEKKKYKSANVPLGSLFPKKPDRQSDAKVSVYVFEWMFEDVEEIKQNYERKNGQL